MTEISGSSNIPTELGFLTIGQIATVHPTEQNQILDYKGPKIILENGFRAEPKFFYISKLDRMYQIDLEDSFTLKARVSLKVLTKTGFKSISALEPKEEIGVVNNAFRWVSQTPNLTQPAMDMFKHLDYLNNNVRWIPIKSRKMTEIVEPGFCFMIPYYKRYIANGIICSD